MSLAATGWKFLRATTRDGKPAAGEALPHPRRPAGCPGNPRGVAGAWPAAWRGRIPRPVGSRTDMSRCEPPGVPRPGVPFAPRAVGLDDRHGTHVSGSRRSGDGEALQRRSDRLALAGAEEAARRTRTRRPRPDRKSVV